MYVLLSSLVYLMTDRVALRPRKHGSLSFLTHSVTFHKGWNGICCFLSLICSPLLFCWASVILPVLTVPSNAPSSTSHVFAHVQSVFLSATRPCHYMLYSQRLAPLQSLHSQGAAAGSFSPGAVRPHWNEHFRQRTRSQLSYLGNFARPSNQYDFNFVTFYTLLTLVSGSCHCP